MDARANGSMFYIKKTSAANQWTANQHTWAGWYKASVPRCSTLPSRRIRVGKSSSGVASAPASVLCRGFWGYLGTIPGLLQMPVVGVCDSAGTFFPAQWPGRARHPGSVGQIIAHQITQSTCPLVGSPEGRRQQIRPARGAHNANPVQPDSAHQEPAAENRELTTARPPSLRSPDSSASSIDGFKSSDQ